jgi:hypothetical protein
VKKTFFAAAFLCAAVAAGCGGGGGSAITYPVATAAPIENVTFSITLPSGTSTRHRDYISSSAESVTIVLVAVPPATPAPTLVINLVSGSADCSNSPNGVTCSGTMSVPAGQQQFIVSTYDQPGGAGDLLSTGAITVLVSASSSNAQNLSNSVSLTLNSIVASITLSVTPNAVNVAADQTFSIALTAYDATGAIIIGPGNFAQGPIFVDVPVLNDPFFPSLKGPLVASFVAPGPPQTLTYDGSALYTHPQGGTLTFTASGVNVTPATATVTFLPAPSPSAVITPTPGATLTPPPTIAPTQTPSPTPTPIPQFNVTPDSITFAGVAPQPTQNFTASETGVSSFTAVSQNTSIATVSGSGSTFTVTAGSTPGQTGIIVRDPSGRTATVTVTVSGQTIIISSTGRPHQ